MTTEQLAADFAERTRAWERERLSELAVHSYDTAGRVHPEPHSEVRTPFQVDRDRILHSRSFRRLASKTQVFIAPEGDHYRTRLTHTLEVTAISRTVARALRLNEDLTEAIGLGHDLGHPPFGHTGERALDEALQERFGRRFLHNENSLRVVEVIEKDGAGLNLTREVRNGILCHTGGQLPDTLEGKIVRIVDRVAYINHDIDDSVRAGILRERDLPHEQIALLGSTGGQRIDTLVRDLVSASAAAGDIVQSDAVGSAMDDLRTFMFKRVYLGAAETGDKEKVADLIPRLVDHYIAHPEQLPPCEQPVCESDADVAQRVTDYIAGMTDRFCLRLCRELFLPNEWRF